MGSSDSHDAGDVSGGLEAPIGQATTVVRARELSETGIRCGVQARHTYVKVTGNDGPDLRFSARPWGNTVDRAIVGDVVHAWGAKFRARVLGGAGFSLLVIEDGVTVETVPDRRRRLRARVPRRRQRALAHPDHERPPDRDGVEPDLDRAGLRALELGRARALPRRPVAAAARARVPQAAGGGEMATLNGLFGPAMSAFRSGVARPQPVSDGIVVVPVNVNPFTRSSGPL